MPKSPYQERKPVRRAVPEQSLLHDRLVAHAPRTKRWPLLVAITLVVSASFVGYRALHVSQHIQPLTHATAAVQGKATNKEAVAAFGAKVNDLIAANSSVDISVSVISMQTGASNHYGESAGFQAASTAKLLTAAAYLHGVEQGQFAIDDTYDGTDATTLLQRMIADSDDGAWMSLNTALGHDVLANYADSLGITDYNSADNILTSGDIALILQKLQNGSLLNKVHKQQLLSYMKQANYRNFIVAGVPDDITVYHKAGETDDEVHDSAILTKGSRSVVLVIYTNGHGTYDWDARATLLQQIAAEAAKDYLAD